MATEEQISEAMVSGTVALLMQRDVLRCERDALKAVLREIVHEFDQTYDAELHGEGRWTDAASIKVATMERAKRLVQP